MDVQPNRNVPSLGCESFDKGIDMLEMGKDIFDVEYVDIESTDLPDFASRFCTTRKIRGTLEILESRNTRCVTPVARIAI